MSRRNIPPNIRVRCLLERDEADSWFAICLDLNLYVRAATSLEARSRLRAEVGLYLQEAYTTDRKHFFDLVRRRAPMRFWLRFYATALRQKISGRRRRERRFAGFCAKVPLAPAHG